MKIEVVLLSIFTSLFGLAPTSALNELKDSFVAKRNEETWTKLVVRIENSNNSSECWYSAIRYADARSKFIFPNSMAVLVPQTPNGALANSEKKRICS